MIGWFRVCIRERRQFIRDRAAQEDGFEILWIESICEDPKVRARMSILIVEDDQNKTIDGALRRQRCKGGVYPLDSGLVS